MKTQQIIDAINKDFASTYKNATPFVQSGALWDFCIDTIKNPSNMRNIVFANDLGVPPVKSLIAIYKRKHNPQNTFKLSAQESQFIGALMGFVFKYVFGYQHQKERCTVNELGVKTATRFFDGPIIEFED